MLIVKFNYEENYKSLKMLKWLRKYFLFLPAIVFFIVLVIIDLFFQKGANNIMRITGLFFLGISAIFFIPPFIILKKFGKTSKDSLYMETERLVKIGSYRIVRHPQYLGYMFLLIGFSLTNQNIYLVILGITSIFSLYLQTLNEEKELMAKFGREYKVYSDQVTRFNFIAGFLNYIRSRL